MFFFRTPKKHETALAPLGSFEMMLGDAAAPSEIDVFGQLRVPAWKKSAQSSTSPGPRELYAP